MSLLYITNILRNSIINICFKTHGRPPGELSEEFVTQKKRKKGWRMNCDEGEGTEGLKNDL